MQDIFSKYKKHKRLQNIGIIAASLFLAIWVNTWLTDSNMSQYLKSNILETQTQIPRSDIYIQLVWDSYEIKSHSLISNLDQISFSLLYNNKNLNLKINENNIDKYTINSNYIDSGILNLQIRSNNNHTIQAWETILKLNLSKNTEGIEHINILNANFTDTTGASYILSTSGLRL